jgi:hypothetical protein
MYLEEVKKDEVRLIPLKEKIYTWERRKNDSVI